MRVHFTHDGHKFEVSAGDPRPCRDDECERPFERTLPNDDRFPQQPTVHHTVSWIVARLAALSHGEIQQLNDGYFRKDGGDFGYRLEVTDCENKLAGRCGLLFFYARVHNRHKRHRGDLAKCVAC